MYIVYGPVAFIYQKIHFLNLLPNRVIYHLILTDFVDKKEFLFSYEFPNFMEHSYQFEPLRKNDNFITQNKIAHIVHSLT